MGRVRFACVSLALVLVVAGARGMQAQPAPQPVPPPAPVQSTPQLPAQPAQPYTLDMPQPDAATPLVAPRPAAQGPVSIRILPSPKTEQELVAERQDREQRSALENSLMIFAGALVAIGFLQFIALAIQGLYLWLALRAMQDPIELAARNFTIAQRAVVSIGSLAWSVFGTNVRVAPTLENGGSTPTRNLRISTNWRAWHGELPPDFNYSYNRPPDSVFLGPRGRAEVGSALIPMRDIQAAIEERLQIYYWGRATYEDIFDGSQPYSIEFCYRLDAAGTPPDKLSLTFTHYGRHNRSEGDNQRPVVLDKR
jgi:hypothetical protein